MVGAFNDGYNYKLSIVFPLKVLGCFALLNNTKAMAFVKQKNYLLTLCVITKLPSLLYSSIS